MTMNATKAEVLTEREIYLVESWRGNNNATGAKQFLDIIDRLCAELTSLRASRDEWQKAVEAKHKWMVEADAEIKRLKGERDAVVKAASDIRGHARSPSCGGAWSYNKRMQVLIPESMIDALDAALAQVSAPAPAKVEVYELGGELYRAIVNGIVWWIRSPLYDKAPWIEDCCSPRYIRKICRRLSDSEAAAFLAEHPLPKDAFSPAPSREQAKDECNCDVRDRQWNPVTKRCNFCHRPIKAAVNAPAPAAPATSGAGEGSVTIKTTPVPKWAQDRIDHALKHGTDAVNSGPHSGLLHRLTLLIAERDELRSANEKLVVAVETFLRDAHGWEFKGGTRSSKKMKQALRDALPRTRVASEILEGLTELHNTVVGASVQMTCPECGCGPKPCLCDLQAAKKIGSSPTITAGPDAAVTLTTRDFRTVEDLLKSPPPPNDALKQAFEDYRIKVAPGAEKVGAGEQSEICPSCKGSGRRACSLGSLCCGQCNGTGKIDPTQDQELERRKSNA